MPRFLRILSAILHTLASASASQSLPGPFVTYKTEPSFFPNNIKVSYHTQDRSLIEPGYTFVAPHIGPRGFGPQIIDQDGSLIWYGGPIVTHVNGAQIPSSNLYPCDFMGQTLKHLCFSEIRPSDVEGRDFKEGAANRILNDAYEQVGPEFVETGDLKTTPNAHEFNVLPGGESFLQAVSPLRNLDLTAYAGPRDGWVRDGCFQEIHLHTRNVLFQWCYLDHHPVWDTYLFLNVEGNTVNSSTGPNYRGTEDHAWDFFHINAVDKNHEGDYIVSSRHLSQILKIAGPNSASGRDPGSTIWRLNGKRSDFVMKEEVKFSRQHHCRFLSTGREESLISIFNNGFNGSDTNTDRSKGMILRLNNVTMEASLDAIYKHPRSHLAYAQGSFSVLPGKQETVQVGWGSFPEWSEFTRNGTLLYHAEAWANKKEKKQYEGRLTNYRAFKSPWIANPRYPPKLVAYSRTCDSQTFAYVSWNGATEVGKWHFYTSATKFGPRHLAGTSDKTSFETRIKLSTALSDSGFAPWVTVEAIDKNDGTTILGTKTSKTFVPPSRLRKHCTTDACSYPERFAYDRRDSLTCVDQPVSRILSQLVSIIVAVECLAWLASWSLLALVNYTSVQLPSELVYET